MRKRTFTRKQYYVTNIVLVLSILLITFITSMVIVYKIQRKSACEKAEIITSKVLEDFDNRISRINEMNKSIFLDTDFQDLEQKYLEEKNFQVFAKIENHFSAFALLEQFLVKDIVFIPFDSNGELNKNNMISFGLNYDFISYNMEEIVSESILPQNQSGKLFYISLKYLDGSDIDFYAMARNVLDMRSETYFNKLGLGIMFINMKELAKTFDYG